MKTNISYFAVAQLCEDGDREAYTVWADPVARLELLHGWRRMGVTVKVLGEFASQKQANQAVMKWAQRNGKAIVAKPADH
jgi:hypothetical protein